MSLCRANANGGESSSGLCTESCLVRVADVSQASKTACKSYCEHSQVERGRMYLVSTEAGQDLCDKRSIDNQQPRDYQASTEYLEVGAVTITSERRPSKLSGGGGRRREEGEKRKEGGRRGSEKRREERRRREEEEKRGGKEEVRRGGREE